MNLNKYGNEFYRKKAPDLFKSQSSEIPKYRKFSLKIIFKMSYQELPKLEKYFYSIALTSLCGYVIITSILESQGIRKLYFIS